MNVLCFFFVMPVVYSSVINDFEWNYPYHALNKYLGFLLPENRQFFNSDDGSYYFQYDTGFGQQQSFRGETRDANGYVKGYFGYVDPDGVLRITEYISDRFGYRVKTTLRYQVFTP